MLRRPRRRGRSSAREGDEEEIRLRETPARVVTTAKRGSGTTDSGTRASDRSWRFLGRAPAFLAKLDAGRGKLDGEALKERLDRVRGKTREMVRDLKVPNVEDLKALIEDIRQEQTEAKYHPDKRRLDAVADFFAYTEEEGACADDETTDEASRRGRGRAEAETETETEAFRGRPGARVFDRTRRLTRT